MKLYHEGLGDKVKIIPYQYKESLGFLSDIKDQDIVYLTDISLPSYNHYQELSKRNVKVISLDHHKTMKDTLIKYNPDLIKVRRDDSYDSYFDRTLTNILIYYPSETNPLSGCGLVSEYLSNLYGFELPPMIRMVIHHVSKRDLWDFSDQDTRPYTSIIHELSGTSPEAFCALFKLWVHQEEHNQDMRGLFSSLLKDGEDLVCEMEEKITLAVDSYLLEPLVKNLSGKIGKVAFLAKEDLTCFDHLSETANKALTLNPDLSAVGVLFYSSYDSKSLIISWRSREGVDLTAHALATERGGGGHILAAGCKIEGMDKVTLKEKCDSNYSQLLDPNFMDKTPPFDTAIAKADEEEEITIEKTHKPSNPSRVTQKDLETLLSELHLNYEKFSEYHYRFSGWNYWLPKGKLLKGGSTDKSKLVPLSKLKGILRGEKP